MTSEDLVNYVQNLESQLKAVTLTVGEMADQLDRLRVMQVAPLRAEARDELIRRELDAHHQRIDSNHNRLGVHQGSIDAQRTSQLELSRRVGEIEVAFDPHLRDRVNAIEKLLAKEGASPMVSQISALSGHVSNHHQRIDMLHNRIAKLEHAPPAADGYGPNLPVVVPTHEHPTFDQRMLEFGVQRVERLAQQVHELDVLLFGDKDLHAKWEAGKVNFPNIPEPGPGWIDRIDHQLAAMVASDLRARDAMSTMIGDVTSKITFVARLEAFFGPMLAGKNPPMDGEQIASKNYVDGALQRLSDALRTRFAEQFNEAAALTKELLQAFAVNYGGKLVGASVVSGFVDKVMWLMIRETNRYNEDLARANKPSRLRAAIYAVTGKTNGAP